MPSLAQFQRRVAPWSHAFVDLLWRPSCFVCDLPKLTASHRQPICPGCLDQLVPLQRPFCDQCGEPFHGVIDGEFRCPNCAGREDFAFDFAISAYQFVGSLRELVHSFKFNSHYELRGLLGWLASHALEEPRLAAREDWVLVPIPLHPLRQREREFNQSAEIARRVAQLSGLASKNGLRRTRETSHQVGLSREQRLKNIRGAFALSKRAETQRWFAGKSVLLVDDVLTTGATADEAARVLKKEGGATHVAVLTLARG